MFNFDFNKVWIIRHHNYSRNSFFATEKVYLNRSEVLNDWAKLNQDLKISFPDMHKKSPYDILLLSDALEQLSELSYEEGHQNASVGAKYE